MSRGSPIIRVRVPAELLARIEAKVLRSQDSKDEPYTLSSWIISAIREKLGKHARSNKGRPGRRQKGGADEVSVSPRSSGPVGVTVSGLDVS